MANDKKNKTVTELYFGPLPVNIINDTLDMELDEGETRMDIPHHKHVIKKHPDDYPKCEPHVASVISNPLYIGDDFKNHSKIELIGHAPTLQGEKLLVAVEIEKDAKGFYNVHSFYPISQSKVDQRRHKRHLLNAIKRDKN